MKVFFAVCAMLLIAVPTLANLTIDFESYTAGSEIAGQDGWYNVTNSGQNQIVSADGNKYLQLDVNATTPVIFDKAIANQVVAGTDLIFSYDLKLISSVGEAWVGIRGKDTTAGVYSGSAGLTNRTNSQAAPHLDAHLFAGNFNNSIVGASVDTAGWHNYAYRFDYVNKKIVSLTVDGGTPILLDYTFYNTTANALNLLEVKLYTGATSGQFGMDNIQLSSAPVPEPGSLLALAAGLVGIAPFVRKRK